jgi:hypothetical protein
MVTLRGFSVFILCICFSSLISQNVLEKYSKVKVNLQHKSISELSLAGIETDHGFFVEGRYFISDFSESEQRLIASLGFDQEVLIDDLHAYYADTNRPSEIKTDLVHRNTNCQGTNVPEYYFKTPANYKAGSMGGYFTYQEMFEHLDSMHAKYPDLISKITPIGDFKTLQGRPIQFLKLSDNVAQEEQNEPKVLYTALHHAREPNSLSQMIFYLWYLLENYGTDPAVTKIVNETQMYFIPCVNPDGYVQNQTTNPFGGGLWRKNMWIDENNALKGVDLNRNYGYFWGVDNQGSSNNPNSNTFRGPAAFSEPETQAVRQLCLLHDFKIAQNYHTFGNLLVHPWGYNDEPTSEDVIFKALGNVMNRENNFLMGTGTETVGYVVNGCSDDWMYGEKGEKKPIFSYTPEVGPSFWPPAQDIDFLNKSTMWMNIATAWLTLSYISSAEAENDFYLYKGNNSILIKSTNAGLQTGQALLTLKSKTNGVTITNSTRTLTLKSIESQNIAFDLVVDPNEEVKDINLVLETNNDGVITEMEINKFWLNKPQVSLYKNDFSTLNTINNQNWGLSIKEYFSPPSSITDSPDGNYPDKFKAEFKLAPFSLENAENALLTFYAKWDIENNYDYVQVLASSDNVDFRPLCGKYTNIGTNDQIFGSQLYDGVKSDWVKEEMSLEDFVNQKQVWIKVIIKTDDFSNKDGFYMDDLEIKVTDKINSIKDSSNNQFTITPSLVSSDGEVSIQGTKDLFSTTALLYDMNGTLIGLQDIFNGKMILKPFQLKSGLYIIQLVKDGVMMGVSKIMVQE